MQPWRYQDKHEHTEWKARRYKCRCNQYHPPNEHHARYIFI